MNSCAVSHNKSLQTVIAEALEVLMPWVLSQNIV
jgi:hypothetical protein